MIKSTINKVIKRYYCKVDDCYGWLRFDDEENEFWLENELKDALNSLGIKYTIEITTAYGSCSLECRVLSIAYLDEKNKLKLFTKSLAHY